MKKSTIFSHSSTLHKIFYCKSLTRGLSQLYKGRNLNSKKKYIFTQQGKRGSEAMNEVHTIQFNVKCPSQKSLFYYHPTTLSYKINTKNRALLKTLDFSFCGPFCMPLQANIAALINLHKNFQLINCMQLHHGKQTQLNVTRRW